MQRGQSKGRALKSQGREFKEGETLALGNKALGAGESAQWVKCWLGDDENLSEPPPAPHTLHPPIDGGGSFFSFKALSGF